MAPDRSIRRKVGEPRLSLRTNLLVMSGSVLFVMAIIIAQRFSGSEVSVKWNSALLLVGLTAAGLAFVVLRKMRSQLNGLDSGLAVFQELIGAIALGLVDYPRLGTGGIAVTAPFVVPIILALLRTR